MTSKNSIPNKCDFAKNFVPAFGEFINKLEEGTLDELPRVSEGIKKWQKWADEIECGMF